MNKDLTVGNPSTVLWKFCLPLFGSIVFQQLYNIADSWVAGKFIGQNALAAVGNSYEITLIFIAFAFGCNIGCSVLVSQLFGAREYGDVKTAVSTAALSSGVVCLLLMLVGILGCDGLLTLINTPKEVFADSALYLDIYVWGLPFVFFYNIATGVFSALGDSKTPLYFLMLSTLTNIVLDLLFVIKFHMGVAGGVLPEQHRRGHSVRHGLQNGRGRRGLGDLPVPGHQLRAGGGRGHPPVEAVAQRGEDGTVFRGAAGTVRGHRHSQRLAAELHFRGQYPDPERH